MSDYLALRGIVVTFLMKLCHKIVEIQFDSMDPSHFHPATDAAGKQLCTFNGTHQTTSAMSNATAWIYTARYMLPVLGGAMSCRWLGYDRLLQIGGFVMLLATGLMLMTVYLGLMCQSSAIIPIAWLLLPLFFGLTQPNILHSFYMWYNLPKLPTIIPALYYFAATMGDWAACLLSPLSEPGHLGSHATLIFIALSAMFIALSFFLPTDINRESFKIPRQSRMISYFKIFSGLILIMFSLSDIRATIYMAEIGQFLNGSTYFAQHTWLSPQLVYLTAMWCSSLILISIGLLYPQKIPVNWRFQLGILLECGVALSLMIFAAYAQSVAQSSAIVAAVYSVASALDGISEMLVMIAAYDLVQQLAHGNSKALVFGIVFTEWGLANIVSGFWSFALGHAPLFTYHLVSLVALLISLVYYRCLSMPLAERLRASDEAGAAAELLNLWEPNCEHQPLLRESVA